MTWARARDFILPALKDGAEDDLLDDIARGFVQLWTGRHAAMATQLVRDPASIHCWLAGGDLDEILALMPGLEAYGRAMGCTHATVDGRKGWARVLKPYGYERDGAELRKVL